MAFFPYSNQRNKQRLPGAPLIKARGRHTNNYLGLTLASCSPSHLLQRLCCSKKGPGVSCPPPRGPGLQEPLSQAPPKAWVLERHTQHANAMRKLAPGVLQSLGARPEMIAGDDTRQHCGGPFRL
jgi:hypothetical protein